jgi:hypothetical protein
LGLWGWVFGFFLYIRTFTNVLLHFFLVGNGQKLGIEAGKYFRWCYIFYFIYIRTFTNTLLCFFFVVKGLRWVAR